MNERCAAACGSHRARLVSRPNAASSVLALGASSAPGRLLGRSKRQRARNRDCGLLLAHALGGKLSVEFGAGLGLDAHTAHRAHPDRRVVITSIAHRALIVIGRRSEATSRRFKCAVRSRASCGSAQDFPPFSLHFNTCFSGLHFDLGDQHRKVSESSRKSGGIVSGAGDDPAEDIVQLRVRSEEEAPALDAALDGVGRVRTDVAGHAAGTPRQLCRTFACVISRTYTSGTAEAGELVASAGASGRVVRRWRFSSARGPQVFRSHSVCWSRSARRSMCSTASTSNESFCESSVLNVDS